MTKMTKIFSLSCLTLAIAACSGGGGGGGNSSSVAATTDASTGSTNSANTPVSAPFKTNTGESYDFQYTLVNNTDTTYLTPASVSSINTAESYKVKPVASQYQSTLDEMIAYANNVRAQKGLNALTVDQGLMAAAQRRAEELVGYYAHTRPDGSDISTLFSKVSSYGENISAGLVTAQATMSSFENSATHLATMINSNFTKTGVGFVYVPGSEYTYYWVQLFANDATESSYAFDTSATAQQHKLESVTTKATNVNDCTNWMIVDNFPIYLAQIPSDGNWYTFTQSDGTTTYEGVANGYNYVRFGLAQAKGAAHNVFYRGSNTRSENSENTGNVSVVEVPQSGTASYKGDAVITDGTNSRYLKSAFQADFANKQLSGVLSENGTKVVDIQAVIRGASFHSPADATVETQGSFFGTNAEELGGIFYNHSTNQYGAFGAKQ